MIEASSTEKPVNTTPRAAAVAHAWLTSSAYQRLLEEAQRRRIHPDALAAQLLERVITEDWWATILDDVRFA